MASLVGVIGSAIGNDPFDRRSWSGSSYYFFSELKRRELIHDAFGVVAPKPLRQFYKAKNFHCNRNTWNNRLSLDLGFRRALTRSLGRTLAEKHGDADVLQIGGYFDFPSVSSGRHFAYYDGNLTSRISSGYKLGVSQRTIMNAIRYERDLLARMDAVFTFSEYLRNSFIKDYAVDKDKIFNVGGGINIERIPDFKPDKNYTGKDILFIGVDFERKGGWDVLKAFRAVRDRYPTAVLHIVGPASLDIPAEQAGGVINHGFLDKSSAELSSLFQKCVLFVMPSLFEPFGIAPLEAMVHQIPAVVKDGWAFREMVEPGANGSLVGRGNVGQLEDTLVRLLAEAERLQAMGTAGRETVLAKYTWSAVVSRLEHAIDFPQASRRSAAEKFEP